MTDATEDAPHAPPALRPMRESDLPALHALSVEVGWPHRLEDWRFVWDVGHGIVAVDGADRVTGSAMWWPFGAERGTLGMIIVSPRLQSRGTGRRLMAALFAQAGERSLSLTATLAGLKLYRQEGFTETGLVHQHQGVAALPASPDGMRTRPATESDLPALLSLDRAATGADRQTAIAALAERSVIHVIEREGEVIGASYARPFGRGHVVGPLIAPDDAAAIALLRPHLEAHAGGFLRTDTPFADGAYADHLVAAGLARVDTGTTMRRGAAPVQRAGRIVYGLVNQAFG